MTPPRDSDLGAAYRMCRELAAEHGRTYYLATRLLPADRRPAVHALYGFARTVDDVVDVNSADNAADPAAERIAAVDRIEAELAAALAGRPVTDPRSGPVVRAVADTIDRYAIPVEYFRAFLASMRMDIPGTPDFQDVYPDMATLRRYMYGSAVVIGLQMLPVLGTTTRLDEAKPHAAALGEAFQLTNFVRDVGEERPGQHEQGGADRQGREQREVEFFRGGDKAAGQAGPGEHFLDDRGADEQLWQP